MVFTFILIGISFILIFETFITKYVIQLYRHAYRAGSIGNVTSKNLIINLIK
jgi:hypothetical protein